VWRSLEDGITTDSFQDAQSVVAEMRRQLQQAGQATGGG